MNATPSARHSDQTPVRLGRYRLLERLGGGATSAVYAAVDDQTGLSVAIKMIAADLQDEPETRERFFREARVTAALPHPNIVRVIEVGDDAGRPYIVMERLQGMRLPAYLSTAAAAPLANKLSLLLQLCDGLQAAHDRGIEIGRAHV